MNWAGKEKERERWGPSSVPEETNFPREASHSFFFCFFFKYMYIQHIYIMYISNIYTICTYIQDLLTSGSGGAPVGQPLQVPGGKALSQPRQHP